MVLLGGLMHDMNVVFYPFRVCWVLSVYEIQDFFLLDETFFSKITIFQFLLCKVIQLKPYLIVFAVFTYLGLKPCTLIRPRNLCAI